MYRIAICDDEPLTAEQNANMTCRILDGWGLCRGADYEVDVYHNPESLLAQLDGQPEAYQLLLLDIQMDGHNGVELASFLREKRIRASLIYITSYPDCAGDAFHTRALDFLVKPVDEKKLAAALDWDYHENYRPERPLLDTADGAIPLDDILYLEAAQHKVSVHLNSADRLIPGTLSGLEQKLPANRFCRSHFSFLVNLSHVEKIARNAVLLDNGASLPVSRSAYQPLATKYIAYLKTKHR